MGWSWPQLLIILLVVALIFGTKKLRNIGGDLGSAIKNFKKGMADDEDTSSEQAVKQKMNEKSSKEQD